MSRIGDRYKRIGYSAVTSLFAKGAYTILWFFCVRILVRYLGTEQYGVLTVIMSLAWMIGLCDFGTSIGAMHIVTSAHARNEQNYAARVVSTTFWFQCLVGISLAIVVALFTPAFSWSSLLGFSGTLRRELAVLLFLIGLLLLQPFVLVERIYLAYQEAYIYDFFRVLSTLSLFALIVLASVLQLDILWISAAVVIATAVGPIAGSLHLYGCRRKWLIPESSKFSLAELRRVLRLGGVFLLMSSSTAIGFGSDSLIASHVLGESSVGIYVVTQTLFGIASFLPNAFLPILWPAVREAWLKGEMDWVRRAFGRFLLLSVGSTALVTVVFVVWGGRIFELWLGPEIKIGTDIRLWFLTWTNLSALIGVVAMFLNGLDLLRFQIYVSLSTTVVAIGLKLVLAPRFGLTGIVAANCAALLFCSIVPDLWVLLRVLYRKLPGPGETCCPKADCSKLGA